MDRLWTPWRYAYITDTPAPGQHTRRGVPTELEGWPAHHAGDAAPGDGTSSDDADCVFCNLIHAVDWGAEHGPGQEASERAGLIVRRFKTCFVCLNRFPYSSGHVLIVPYRHTDSLARLSSAEATELISAAQQMETALRQVYQPDGINLGMNLGKSAGAGVAGHVHMHALPRWTGDTNFMTVVADTRILPETLETSWSRIRDVFLAANIQPDTTRKL